ncbi:MAG: DUF362 domain-containing protein [Candidatus Hodarchaeales archaeon]
MADNNQVFLIDCTNYDPREIKNKILEGIQALNIKFNGRVTIKPNVVIAHKKAAPHSYTRPEFLEGLILAINESGTINKPIRIVERSGATISTKAQFKRAGYYKLKKKSSIPIKLEPMEKTRTIEVELKKGKLHDKVTVAESLVNTENLIYTPKFKFNILVNGITGALKLNIGILDDKERMMFHDMRLDDKIVDLHEVGKPNFIAVDAITAGHGGSQLTSQPYPLGLIILGTNSLAVDVICNWIINHDPLQIGHLIKAHERGIGPLDLEEIELLGVDIKIFQERAKDFDKGYVLVNEFPTNIDILVGDGIVDDFSGKHKEYCQGGCHGIVLDELLMAKDRDPSKPHKFNKNIKLVIGNYIGDVESKTVILIGDCTKVVGEIKSKKIIRVKGCPPTHKELVAALALDAGLYVDLLRFSLLLPELKFFTPKFLKRIHKPQAWKTLGEVLKHY